MNRAGLLVLVALPLGLAAAWTLLGPSGCQATDPGTGPVSVGDRAPGDGSESPTRTNQKGGGRRPAVLASSQDEAYEEDHEDVAADGRRYDPDSPAGKSAPKRRTLGVGTDYGSAEQVARLEQAAPKLDGACDGTCPDQTVCYRVREGSSATGITWAHRCVPLKEGCDVVGQTCECLKVDPCRRPWVCHGFPGQYEPAQLKRGVRGLEITCGPSSREKEAIKPRKDCNTPNCE